MRIQVTTADIAASRYAISPLGETIWAMRLCAGQYHVPGLTPWLARTRPAYQRLRRELPAVGALLRLLRRGGYNADFVHPPPRDTGQSFADELAAFRSTPLAQARAELARNLKGLPTPPAYAQQIYRSPDVVDRLADAIEAAWTTLVEPDWPRLRTILERDLVQRAGRLVTYGWGAAVADLDPRLSWEADGPYGTVVVADGRSETHSLDGRGLLFVPTAFGKMINYVEPPWPFALVYRASGVADLLGPADPTRPPDALDRLLGRTRAAVLRALAVPATTTQLVRQLDLTLGGVGGHLTVLREAGLVTRTRTGREVRYARTPLGDALVHDVPDAPAEHRTAAARRQAVRTDRWPPS